MLWAELVALIEEFHFEKVPQFLLDPTILVSAKLVPVIGQFCKVIFGLFLQLIF